MVERLKDAVAVDYYRTTAVRSHSPTLGYYDRCADGLLRWLGPWLPSDKRARCVDLACGCGELLYLLERQGFTDTAGVDLSADELEQAGRFVKAKLANTDILAFLRSSADSSVDSMFALNILEHLDKDTLLAVLRETRRTLRPGGTLIAIVPNAVSPYGSLTRHWDITHEWAFTTNNFRQLASAVGFEERVEFRECGPVAHGLVSGLRFLLWRIIRVGIAARFLIELGTTKDGIYTMDMIVRLHRKSGA